MAGIDVRRTDEERHCRARQRKQRERKRDPAIVRTSRHCPPFRKEKEDSRGDAETRNSSPAKRGRGTARSAVEGASAATAPPPRLRRYSHRKRGKSLFSASPRLRVEMITIASSIQDFRKPKARRLSADSRSPAPPRHELDDTRGRFPGSRLHCPARLPGCPVAFVQNLVLRLDRGIAAYSCGGSPGVRPDSLRRRVGWS